MLIDADFVLPWLYINLQTIARRSED